MGSIILPNQWARQPQYVAQLATLFRPTSKPAILLGSQGFSTAYGTGFQLTQTNSGYTGSRFYGTTEGQALRLYADHGGNNDDRLSSIDQITSAKAGPFTTVFLFRPISYSTGDQRYLGDNGHRFSFVQSTGAATYVGYDGGNGYRRTGDFPSGTIKLGQWNCLVISTKPQTEISCAINGNSPTSYSGLASYVGDGSIGNSAYVTIASYEFTNYYHANAEIALFASLPGVYIDQSKTIELSTKPWQIFEPQKRRIWVPSAGGGGVNGTLSQTLDNVTSSATGTVLLQGTLSRSLDAATLLADGVLVSPVVGELDKTLGTLVSTATGTVLIQGTLSQTLDATTLASTGELTQPGSGTLSQTLGNATLSATSTLALKGTASVNLDALGLNATSAILVKGVLTQTLENTSLLASGGELSGVSGVLSQTLENLVLSAAGGGLWSEISPSTTLWAEVTPSSTTWTEI